MNFAVLKYKINKRLIWLLGDKKYNNYLESLKNCISNGYENNAIIELTKEKAALYRKNVENGVVPNVASLNIFPLISLINELSQYNTIQYNTIQYNTIQ